MQIGRPGDALPVVRDVSPGDDERTLELEVVGAARARSTVRAAD